MGAFYRNLCLFYSFCAECRGEYLIIKKTEHEYCL